MEHVKLIFFFFFTYFLMFLPFIAFSQKDTFQYTPQLSCFGRKGNFTANSTFSSNLNRLVSSLSSLSPTPYGFYNLSSGDSTQETAYATALCRRDVKRDACLTCIQTAAKTLTDQCPTSKQAIVFYTHCMFRYSNTTLYGIKATKPILYLISGTKVSTNKGEFDRLQLELLDRLRVTAAAGGLNRKYAQGNGSSTGNYTRFYGSAQCTPDLSEQHCNECLIFGFEDIRRCCDGQDGLRWFCPSCNFRVETGRFYEFESDLESDPIAIKPADPPTSLVTKGKSKSGSKVIIAVVIAVVLATVFAIFVCLILKCKGNKSGVLGDLPFSGSMPEEEFLNTDSLLVDFETLKVATDNFSPENELGRGGFGSVYKGVFSGGQEIAVKRLSVNSGQGDIEFKNEILLLAKLQHRNLVRLLCFCIEGEERLLVYEYIKNSSLDHFIFDLKKRQDLDWGMRYKMIGGVAKGLLYLHEDSRYRIIHRDLKASNVLLDNKMNPKIADFGLATLFDTSQTMTHRFTSRIAGTYGYMAPEYAIHGQFSVKTDVFSFGVLVIEIITGKRNNARLSDDDENAERLLRWVWRSWEEDVVLSVIDPSLTTGSRNEILRCIHIGLLCVQENATTRPTMSSVGLMLSSYSYTLPVPSRPAFVLDNINVTPLNVSSSTEGLQMSLNDVTVSELSPR